MKLIGRTGQIQDRQKKVPFHRTQNCSPILARLYDSITAVLLWRMAVWQNVQSATRGCARGLLLATSRSTGKLTQGDRKNRMGRENRRVLGQGWGRKEVGGKAWIQVAPACTRILFSSLSFTLLGLAPAKSWHRLKGNPLGQWRHVPGKGTNIPSL